MAANRAESLGPSEDSVAPVTRSRRRTVKNVSVTHHVSASAYELHAFSLEEAEFMFLTSTLFVLILPQK